MAIMGEILQPDEPMYDGKMTNAEWVTAEVDIDLNLPDFEHPAVPYIDLSTPEGKFRAHHWNTTIVQYPDKWQRMSHIVLADASQYEIPIYFFRDTETQDDEEKNWIKIAHALLERDFELTQPPERPRPEVIHMYWQGVRGGEPIEGILKRIIDNGTESL